MDGIPGVTQDAVEPGKSFTYEFEANVLGTYWYHSHQDSVNQLDRGLYGTFVVEDTNEKYDKDYTLMLDEWITDKEEMNKQLKEMTKGKTEKADGNKSSKGNENTKRMMIRTAWIILVWTWTVIKRLWQYGRNGPWKYEDGRS